MFVPYINVTSVTKKKFNDVILNPINNVNASMFNVISVIITPYMNFSTMSVYNIYCKVLTLVVAIPAHQGHIQEVSGSRTTFQLNHILSEISEETWKTCVNHCETGSWNPRM